MMMSKNCLSYWFPIIESAGLPVPKTRIVRTDLYLGEGWPEATSSEDRQKFLDEFGTACDEIGFPCFIRTGLFSDKWSWSESCYLYSKQYLTTHVDKIALESQLVDFIGLATDVWVARELIPTTPLFHAFRGCMPVVREFRFFVRDGAVEHIQPYWPEDSIRQPSAPDWKERLHAASQLTGDEERELTRLAIQAGVSVGGYWSIDFLQASDGNWWLTDMALGENSF